MKKIFTLAYLAYLGKKASTFVVPRTNHIAGCTLLPLQSDNVLWAPFLPSPSLYWDLAAYYPSYCVDL